MLGIICCNHLKEIAVHSDNGSYNGQYHIADSKKLMVLSILFTWGIHPEIGYAELY